ncbi:hypothetical protein [Streptomyces cyaneofuscatus]|uniref:hypothetical protein n=1 Tax=Streptomyces cyaneofuscatus TaxID=66883 RepID=UPI00364D706E
MPRVLDTLLISAFTLNGDRLPPRSTDSARRRERAASPRAGSAPQGLGLALCEVFLISDVAGSAPLLRPGPVPPLPSGADAPHTASHPSRGP